jgi:mono/diheme cytochrome c family protein
MWRKWLAHLTGPCVLATCLLGALYAGVTPPGARADDADAAPQRSAEPTFYRDIFPIIQAKCLRCHNPRKRDGKLDMSTVRTMLKGGSSGAAFVPGDAKKSLMVDLIFFDEMPPQKERPRVSRDELKRVEAWINAGAAEGEKPKADESGK